MADTTAMTTTRDPVEERDKARNSEVWVYLSRPRSVLLEDSNSTSVIYLGRNFKRVYETRNAATPEILVESMGDEVRIPIPADKSSVHSIISSGYKFPVEWGNDNCYWLERTPSNELDLEWTPAGSSWEALIPRVMEALGRMIESESDEGKKVEVRTRLVIRESILVSEDEYQEIHSHRAEVREHLRDRYESFLFNHQRFYTASFGSMCSEDVAKSALTERMEIELGDDVKVWLDAGTIDAIARRAFEAWEKVFISEIKVGLVYVKEEEGGSKLKGEECSICLRPMVPTEEEEDLKIKSCLLVVRLAECRHCFHQSCLLRWRTQAPTCPLCRSSPPSLP